MSLVIRRVRGRNHWYFGVALVLLGLLGAIQWGVAPDETPTRREPVLTASEAREAIGPVGVAVDGPRRAVASAGELMVPPEDEGPDLEELRLRHSRMLDEKIERMERRVTRGCGALVGLDAWLRRARADRDVIVESSLLTASGRKTKAAQRSFEERVLRSFDTAFCEAYYRASSDEACRRALRTCGPVLAGYSTWDQ